MLLYGTVLVCDTVLLCDTVRYCTLVALRRAAQVGRL
jgi:hypothetical protein